MANWQLLTGLTKFLGGSWPTWPPYTTAAHCPDLQWSE